MQEKEISRFLRVLIRMGGALKNCGAEVYRVEDTLNRIAKPMVRKRQMCW